MAGRSKNILYLTAGIFTGLVAARVLIKALEIEQFWLILAISLCGLLIGIFGIKAVMKMTSSFTPGSEDDD